MAGGRPYDEERFRALLLYAFRRGMTNRIKLAVLLWRCDFDAYAQQGTSLTGATYYKDVEFGAPKTASFDRVCSELVAEGLLPFEPWPPYPRFRWLERVAGALLAAYVLVRAVAS